MAGPLLLVVFVVVGGLTAMASVAAWTALRDRRLSERQRREELHRLEQLRGEAATLDEGLAARASMAELRAGPERRVALRAVDRGLRELGLQVELAARLQETIAHVALDEEGRAAAEKLKERRREAEAAQGRILEAILRVRATLVALLGAEGDEERHLRKLHDDARHELVKQAAPHDDIARFVSAARRA